MLLFHQDKEILSIERVTLRESGMRYICDYEIVMKDGKAEISEYGIRFENGEDRRILRRRTEVAESEALALLNKCRLLSWNGFNGRTRTGCWTASCSDSTRPSTAAKASAPTARRISRGITIFCGTAFTNFSKTAPSCRYNGAENGIKTRRPAGVFPAGHFVLSNSLR